MNRQARRMLVPATLAALQVACAHAQAQSPAPEPPPASVSMTPVSDTRQEPFASVCKLEVTRRGLRGSTGFLIAPGVLLTAGHNLYSPFYNRVHDLKVKCGWQKNETPVWAPTFTFDRNLLHVADNYWWRKFRWDYALVRLPPTTAPTVSFRLLAATDAPVTVGETVFLAGYPGDESDGVTLKTAQAVVTALDAELISYNIDAERGASGSPVWVRRGNENIIVGIHVVEGAQSQARRVNDDLRREVAGWMGP